MICISEVVDVSPAYLDSSLQLIQPGVSDDVLSIQIKQTGDSRQSCRTPFSILNQSAVPYRGLTIASWPAYRFLRRQYLCTNTSGLPNQLSGKEPTCQCRGYKRSRFDPWVRKIPRRRAWQPTPVFLPGESCGLRRLSGCNPRSHK